jgi:membrane protease YdiL (CAAX protease family)
MGVIAVVAPDIVAMLLRRLSSRMIEYMPADQFGSILRGKALFTFIPVCIVGAFWEELCFRGVGMYAAPPGRIGTVIAIFVSSLIFGLHHLRGGFQSVIFTSYCGVIFCTLYLVTRDLPSVMLAHALGNLAVAFYFAPKARWQRRPLPSFF